MNDGDDSHTHLCLLARLFTYLLKYMLFIRNQMQSYKKYASNMQSSLSIGYSSNHSGIDALVHAHD